MKPIQVKTTQGQRYRILREVNCLSQQAVNEHMGRASSWCSQLEKDCFELTVDAALKIARMYKVKAYPTLLIIDGTGKLIKQVVGFKDEDQLIAFANSVN